jgi:hypothetical protein
MTRRTTACLAHRDARLASSTDRAAPVAEMTSRPVGPKRDRGVPACAASLIPRSSVYGPGGRRAGRGTGRWFFVGWCAFAYHGRAGRQQHGSTHSLAALTR